MLPKGETVQRARKFLVELVSGRGETDVPDTFEQVLAAERAEDKALAEDAKKGIFRERKGVQFNVNAPAGSAAGEGGPPAGPGTAAGEGGPPAR